MQIAIASGKGGTGKTTVAINLAWIAAHQGRSVAYLDCDVEEPNGHLFLRPEITDRQAVVERIPQVDLQKCTRCGRCGKICQYSAIVSIGKTVLVYPDLCHSCGGCRLVCPTGAITEIPLEIGSLERGTAGAIQFVQGSLKIGKARAVPVIQAVKSVSPQVDLVIRDAPPGTSCPVVESVRGADYVVLVTEPTPFGLHDLRLAVEVMHALKLPCGVVVNRAGSPANEVRWFCGARQIPILAEIPDDRRLAEAYAQGSMICEALPEYETVFAGLLDAIARQARTVAA
ncbi:MAG: P-loop NTPase [Rhodopirellula sp.]|nr:P-loop NTPase [Rhodopirellula sp.]